MTSHCQLSRFSRCQQAFDPSSVPTRFTGRHLADGDHLQFEQSQQESAGFHRSVPNQIHRQTHSADGARLPIEQSQQESAGFHRSVPTRFTGGHVLPMANHGQLSRFSRCQQAFIAES